MKYKLLTPFKETTAGELLTHVTLREVQTVGDQLAARRAGKEGIEAVYFTLARMCGLTMTDIELMDTRDADALLERMAKLYEPPTPEGSDPKA